MEMSHTPAPAAGLDRSSAQRRRFRRRFFPDASPADWRDWRWQMRNALRSPQQLRAVFRLSEAEEAALQRAGDRLPLSITPYYASLLDVRDPGDPLRRTMLPVPQELEVAPGELTDPLGEDEHSPVPGIVHRYPDRALFLLTDRCPVYCRYCTRARLVGGGAPVPPGTRHWPAALDYLRRTPAIRDVLVSGGDPLLLHDDKLLALLRQLRAIPHVEMIRIGSKIPLSLPMRVTPALCRGLRKLHPLYLSLHTTHPREFTSDGARACARLADAGVPLQGQTVLLQGVNDNADVLRALMHRCLQHRVKPYYLLQGDLIAGSAHFRTSVERGLDLVRSLRGHTSGYAVPAYIIDLPGGGGKVQLAPPYVSGEDGDDLLIRNYQGVPGWRYPAH